MGKRQFKAESKKLLDMMINSIYTHKEIFLRELISNASDALDKLYYQSLQSGDTGIRRSDFHIDLSPDADARTLTITDNGVGMTKKELEENLGTIARSGSLEFKKKMEETAEEAEGSEAEKAKKADRMTDIIGQFGVGFYSAFMVADRVTVTSKAYGSDEAFVWTSAGADGYTIDEGVKDSCGTEIVLHLKPDTDDENYSQYLQEYMIRGLIRRYSDYVHYPIRMMVTKSRPKAGQQEEKDENGNPKPPEMESYQELETLNSMEPIWKKQKSKVSPEEYNEYYKSKFGDYRDPCRVIRTSVEGVSSYTALLFIPSEVPYDYYSTDYEKGLQLYSSGVLIMDKCKELLPDYFNFVRGLVDSQDLSLNISRETLQHDRQLLAIERNLEKKIRKELEKFLKEDREGYEKFFGNFGRQLKYGLYDKFGANKDTLQDLVLFHSSTEKKLVTLSEYVSRMKEDQKYIYFAAGETNEKIALLPQVAAADEKGIEVLYLTDEVDEFALRMMRTYQDKEFRSAIDEELEEAVSDEEKKAAEDAGKTYKALLDFMQETFAGAVSEVTFSARLGDAPASLSTKGGISLEMEKTLNRVPTDRGIRAERVLELNPGSDVVKKVIETFGTSDEERTEEQKEKTAKYARLLLCQAELLAGLSVEDPQKLAEDMNALILS